MTANQFIGTLNNPAEKYPDFMGQDWLEAMYKELKAVYITGQLEKGEEGTVHLQYFINLGPKAKARLSALKKVCKHSHFEIVKKDNGASTYCQKEETRIEGPWTFGILPARVDKKGDRARHNMELVTMGPAKALEEGLIAVKDYLRVK